MPNLVAQTRVFIEVISIWMYSRMRSFSDKRSESSWKDMPTELTETITVVAIHYRETVLKLATVHAEGHQ
ncbi:hypothetical protein Mangalitsa_033 [Escherichia phage Mangalitsa]|uniref:Uncharacterized protein n=1 Tax=Escherichia phage Mangalitsa TaxID=2589658 RepID=A0A5B9N4Z7_9CAUD|nr:hypothetical protein HWC55_gp33 [Escherichia phage Mangalitsa]QEG07835.1 hypothetical protein Mangalitsa_033 [Escherichia phage Mangalitsa]